MSVSDVQTIIMASLVFGQRRRHRHFHFISDNYLHAHNFFLSFLTSDVFYCLNEDKKVVLSHYNFIEKNE